MPRLASNVRRFTIGLGAILLGLLSVMPVAAVGDTVLYRHFTVRDGLPHASVFSLDQGPNEQLWIGTASGLAVYDGHTIRSVALPDSLRTAAFSLADRWLCGRRPDSTPTASC